MGGSMQGRMQLGRAARGPVAEADGREIDRGRALALGRKLGAIAVLAVIAQLGLALPAPPADADPSIRPYSHNRYYAGLGVGGSIPTGNAEDDDDVDPSVSFHVRAGGRFHPHWSAEGQLEWHDRFDGPGVHYTAWTLGAAGRYHFLKGRWQPTALLGLGVMNSRKMGDGSARSDIGPALRFGGGITYFLHADYAATLDAIYVRPFGQPDDLDFFAFQLTFEFY